MGACDVWLVRARVGDQVNPDAFAVEPDRCTLGAQAKRSRLPIPGGGHRTCSGTEDGALLAGISTMSWSPVRHEYTSFALRVAACRDRAPERSTSVPCVMHV
jgi:hypothetical protein